ncbi:type IV secretory system conjugative DNA transfer family protein [Faecalicoccus acidiformans]|uniref:type IV secretory system conjugative DNA transfer family protein n=1 Tax=Faecalicoccus acidiformans TaxID=915173 RepID=UPI0025A38DDA|nr:type IV secretory system conjugative DNA transfer family protein [Faecalicoccus acidiformans]MDM8202794.1 type IV secretory system conjugative DNA transfer family protein [Faecalicoccus acidiformans]
MKPRDWILLFSPLGLVLGIFLSGMIQVLVLKNDMLYFGISDQMVQMISIGIVLVIWCIFVLVNIYQYFIEGRRDFSLLKKPSISKDKRIIMYPRVPKKYLSNQPDDFTIGKYRNRYFRIPIDTNDIKHTLIIGSPGSFKSSTLLNTLIWNFNFEKEKRPMTVFALDVKPELSRKCIAESRDDVRIINPSVNTGCGFNVWYGLNQNSSDDRLIERADLISRTLISNPSGNGDNEFFYISAQNLMVPFLVYGFRKGMGFVETILQIIRIPLQDLITTILMDEDIQINQPKVIGMLTPYDGKDSEAIQDIELTLRQDLRIFDTDTVKFQFDQNPQKASPADLTKGISIFLALPDHLLKQYSPIFRLITQMVLNYLSSIPEYERAEKDVPMVLLLIDEGGSIGRLQIQEPLARIRSRKVSIWLACQGLSQLDLTYGHDGTRTILDNTETTLVFSCKDKPTAEIISSWCGQYQETKISRNKKHTSMFGDQSLTTSSEYRNVMDVTDIMALRKNKELLVFDEGNRYLIKKCPYWQIPLLKKKSDEIKKINE